MVTAVVLQVEYFNTSTYNNATKREIRIEITNETPKELYLFSYDNASANWVLKLLLPTNQFGN